MPRKKRTRLTVRKGIDGRGRSTKRKNVVPEQEQADALDAGDDNEVDIPSIQGEFVSEQIDPSGPIGEIEEKQSPVAREETSPPAPKRPRLEAVFDDAAASPRGPSCICHEPGPATRQCPAHAADTNSPVRSPVASPERRPPSNDNEARDLYPTVVVIRPPTQETSSDDDDEQRRRRRRPVRAVDRISPAVALPPPPHNGEDQTRDLYPRVIVLRPPTQETSSDDEVEESRRRNRRRVDRVSPVPIDERQRPDIIRGVEQPVLPVSLSSTQEIATELGILANEIENADQGDDPMDEDGYVEVEAVNVPVGNDPVRQELVDNARQNDVAERARTAAEIERERNRAAQVPTYLRAAIPEANVHHAGAMDRRCEFCQAKFFFAETTTRGSYSKCCQSGKVQLQPLREHPPLLRQLFRGQHELSREFKKNINVYNNMFQFACVHNTLRDIPGVGPYVYAIQGQISYHYSDININNRQPSFGPLYFLDPVEAARQREGQGRNFNVNRRLIELIGEILQEVNPFAQQYRHLYQVYERQTEELARRGIRIPNIYLEFVAHHRNRREYDLPQVEEVAAVCQYDEGRPPNPNMRVFLTEENNRTRPIDAQSQYVDPLVFPLLFPRGDLGWNAFIPLVNQAGGAGRGRVSICEYYAYRLAHRFDDQDEQHFDVFRFAGPLTQKIVVSGYLAVERNRLQYFRLHQDQLRAEEYEGLADYLAQRGQQENIPIGRMIVLPSSFNTGPRSQQQRYLDAIAVMAKVGYPSIFVTMTCNPRWEEIVENIPAGSQPSDHPLLICRVFQMKLRELMKDLTERHVMGVCEAWIYVIEFQKRGLPHAHILLTLRREDKLVDDVRIDQLISAEIPDRETFPELFHLVGQQMIHGPCGLINPQSVCMQADGSCKAHFPKYWYNNTTIRNSIVNYRRRRDGRQIEKRQRGRVYLADNTFVVSYNPYLLLKYKTHICVEASIGGTGIKYLYKYMHKGPDQALVQLVEQREEGEQAIVYDEIENYLNARYMTPPEASWHLLQYEFHGNSHAVVKLQIHLPGRQQVIFERGREPVALERNVGTMLTEWFEKNRRDPLARRFLYVEFPFHYVWNINRKQWTNRQRTLKPIVVRMHNVSVKTGELYYLRLLLLHVRGATSFEHLRTVDGEVCETFLEACRRRNLLADDQEWVRCLTEAVERDMPIQLRKTFAYILIFAEVNDPPALWNRFRQHFLEDFVNRRGLAEDEAEQAALSHIQFICRVNGRRLAEFGLPEPAADFRVQDVVDPPIDAEQERRQAAEMVEQLNADQRAVFDAAMAAVDDDRVERRLFFVKGAAGTGKTFLYNAIIAHLNGREMNVLAVAWTGLAASLLRQGRTVHSRFKLPVPTSPTSTSSLTYQSEDAAFIRAAKLIIWDEVSTSTRVAFNLVDRTLRFLCDDERPFGGKCVIVGGDFKQCLPVVVHGDRTTIVESCVKSSELWPLFEHVELLINMRVEPDERDFMIWLDHLGNGTLPTLNFGTRQGLIEIPRQCVVDSLDQLIHRVLGDLRPGDVPNKAILTPLNEDCHRINQLIVDGFENVAEKVYASADSVVANDNDAAAEEANFPVEILNTLTPSGVPSHRLCLKVGVIVMLLRNLNVRENLCNGTRLLIRRLGEHYVEGEIITFDGRLSGQREFIPRIDFVTNGNNTLPFTLRRRQFPLRVSYAMTINKAQGQTFDSVGIYLPNVVFDHGQLYVAFSRARTESRVFVYAEDTQQQGRLVAEQDSVYTKNIVYREVL